MSSDYPEGRGRVRIDSAGIAIEGVSIAGHESFYKLPGFHTLLEFGRAPDDTVGYATVCLTHGHLDHAAGLAHHASRRTLQGLPPARVFAPRRRSRTRGLARDFAPPGEPDTASMSRRRAGRTAPRNDWS
jgi:ribonuclease BN (tRNA processing enzyme)